MRKNSIPDAVREADELNLHGNLIPHRWYTELRTPGGQPDYAAITILAEIVYWYRPLNLLDENGRPYLKKKFSGDRFKCAAAYFKNKFGMSKDQTRDAIKRLVDRGLIDRYYDVGVLSGVAIYNMMFIEPIISEIKKISEVDFEEETSPKPALNDTPSVQNDTPSVQNHTLSSQNETPSAQNETVSSRDEQLKIKDIKTTTNNNNRDRNGGSSGSVSGDHLIFDGPFEKWAQTRRQNAANALSGLNIETAQQVLDELQDAMSGGNVRRPLAWLKKVAEKAKTGEFQPTNEIAEYRKREKAQKNGRARNQQSTEEVLRGHARAQGVDEEEYLKRMGVK